MKKKWTAIVLAIGMVFSITACGGKDKLLNVNK